MKTDVVIAGGGPNGLLLACELALAGVVPIVLEIEQEPQRQPKANGLVGRVVQALDYRDIYQRFSGMNTPPKPLPYFQFGAMKLDLSAIPDTGLCALLISQHTMVELLEQHARELGVEIRRGHELLTLQQESDRVRLRVRGPHGEYSLEPRFLVGADGGHSEVREQCGIDFPGHTDDGFMHRSGLVTIRPPIATAKGLDVPGIGLVPANTFIRTEHGLFAYIEVGPNTYRVTVFEWSDPEPEASDVSLGELADALRQVLGVEIPISEPENGQRSAIRRRRGANTRQAARYRKDRVFLLGDAAHVHSGVGGPGLNLGMQDALNLGWKLAAEIHEWAPPGLLDTYHQERHPAGRRVMTHTKAQTALLGPGANVTALREVFGELLTDPNTVRHIAETMAGSDTAYAHGAHQLVGRWMPDLLLHKETRVAELMRTARPVLLNLSGNTAIEQTAAGWADRVDIVAATSVREPPATAMLIRPDGYVAWAVDTATTEGLTSALRAWFGEEAPKAAFSVEGVDADLARLGPANSQ